MEKFRKPRGTMDIMSPEIYVWNKIEASLRKTAINAGFEEIRTPTFEELSLFSRGVGDTTDVVQKEMYTFKDKEDKVFALRPEGTASVVRAILENGKCSDTMPLKLFYIINCFRYEKPQAGRSREFFQFGTELIGAKDAGADFTVISLANTAIKNLGINNVTLHINSIGCPNCRPNYRKTLVDYLTKNEGELCETCKTRMKQNPLRVLDCKNESCSKVAINAPRTLDYLCPECEKHFEDLKRYLDSCGIKYVVDPHIVRGLDYYTKSVFEFVCDSIGAQGTICGGGRYDNLVEELGGPSLPAIGFGMGITRLILAMQQCGVEFPTKPCPEVYIASMGPAANEKALQIVNSIRNKGVFAECDIMGRSLKSQMKYADKIGAKNVLIIGDSEIESGVAQLKNMSNSQQSEVSIVDIESLVNELLSKNN